MSAFSLQVFFLFASCLGNCYALCTGSGDCSEESDASMLQVKSLQSNKLQTEGSEVCVWPVGNASTALPLDWGHPLQGIVDCWPAVVMDINAGSDTNVEFLNPMLDTTLHVTVDYSRVGCRQVAAFQAVNAKINRGCYCDGNALQARTDDPYAPGNCTGPLNELHKPCVEIDFVEGNKYSWKTTIHGGSVNGANSWNEGLGAGLGGDQVQQVLTLKQYGPDGCIINTSEPFNASWAFPSHEFGGKRLLAYVEVTLSQGRQSFVFTVGKGLGANLTDVTAALDLGMAPGFSYWSTPGSGSAWYDIDVCNASEIEEGPMTFSNWRMTAGL